MPENDAQQQQLDSSFPAPPEYYTLFTDENLAKLSNATTTNETNIQEDAILKFLVPPPPPTSGTYTNFGRIWQVSDRLPTLEEQKIPQLYPEGPIDRVAELKKLNHSILFEFFSLVDVLIKDPSQYGVCSERLRDILVNIHHLINEYRAHQAKETLKLMLRQQIDSKRQSAANVIAKCQELEQIVAQLKQEAANMEAKLSLPPGTEDTLEAPACDQNSTDSPANNAQSPKTPATCATVMAPLSQQGGHIADSGMKAIVKAIQDLALS